MLFKILSLICRNLESYLKLTELTEMEIRINKPTHIFFGYKSYFVGPGHIICISAYHVVQLYITQLILHTKIKENYIYINVQ